MAKYRGFRNRFGKGRLAEPRHLQHAKKERSHAKNTYRRSRLRHSVIGHRLQPHRSVCPRRRLQQRPGRRRSFGRQRYDQHNGQQPRPRTIGPDVRSVAYADVSASSCEFRKRIQSPIAANAGGSRGGEGGSPAGSLRPLVIRPVAGLPSQVIGKVVIHRPGLGGERRWSGGSQTPNAHILQLFRANRHRIKIVCFQCGTSMEPRRLLATSRASKARGLAGLLPWPITISALAS